MAIKLKIVNKEGEVREVTLQAGVEINLQAGEQIDITASEGLELVLVNGTLVISDGLIEVNIGGFANSGGLISGGKTITAQQVASGEFNGVEVVDVVVEAENTETTFEAENTEIATDSSSTDGGAGNALNPVADVLAGDGGVDSLFVTGAEQEDTSQATTRNEREAEAESEAESQTSPVEPESLPSFSPISLLNVASPFLAAEEEVFTFTPEATGGSGNYTYEVTLTDGSELPEWLVFDPATGTISGIPDDGNLETLEIRIIVTDSQGLVSPQEFTTSLSISGVNDVPVLSLGEGDELLGGITITDADLGSTLSKATVTITNGEAGDRLGVDVDNSGLTAVYENGVLTLSGTATAGVYQSVLDSLAIDSSEGFTVGGDRILNVVVTDDQGAESNSANATVNVLAENWSFSEDGLIGSQIAGSWLPAGSSGDAFMSKVVMTFNGKDYVREIGGEFDTINDAGDFKIGIKDPDGTPPIPEVGAIYFRADGTIELVANPLLNFLPKDLNLPASFTYTVNDGGSTTEHTFGMDVTGQNDAPVLNLGEGDELLGGITITDADLGSTLSKATVTITNGEAGDRLGEWCFNTVRYCNGWCLSVRS
ncbi:VCBS repeat protein [Endozoicomonas montiporae CL-33]|uniref:VCBS repeat protein n=1 Tax=Endozoicomonas montiporae CL-33 TaxID=570277 RepID=A0A142B9T9_9GAMM|nr:putative Ig domain-containing protein [Endozoicomonas montiporae]AMO55515.1 VCBS repeat protein [Endozoicomonas montiporae CL-33]